MVFFGIYAIRQCRRQRLVRGCSAISDGETDPRSSRAILGKPSDLPNCVLTCGQRSGSGITAVVAALKRQ
jgi:hypothetical protein